jgi:hypothetical protein
MEGGMIGNEFADRLDRMENKIKLLECKQTELEDDNIIVKAKCQALQNRYEELRRRK